jgi:hypothetical protein
LGLLDPQVQRVQQLAELLPVRARVSACLSAVMRDGARECSMQSWLVSPMLFAAAMAAVGCFFQPISDAGSVACRYECPG